MSLFIKASRAKLRFETARGRLGVDDLWDLPISGARDGIDLNTLAQQAYRDNQTSTVPDFSGTAAPVGNAKAALQLDVLKAIIEIKRAEADSAENEAVRRTKNERIDALIAEKREEELKNLSVEALEKLRV